MGYDLEKIRLRLRESISEHGSASEEAHDDIVFHLSDWLEDLHSFHQFCKNPSSSSSEQIHELLVRFLTHVPNHLAAASKLFLDIPVTGIFDVGATSAAE